MRENMWRGSGWVVKSSHWHWWRPATERCPHGRTLAWSAQCPTLGWGPTLPYPTKGCPLQGLHPLPSKNAFQRKGALRPFLKAWCPQNFLRLWIASAFPLCIGKSMHGQLDASRRCDPWRDWCDSVSRCSPCKADVRERLEVFNLQCQSKQIRLLRKQITRACRKVCRHWENRPSQTSAACPGYQGPGVFCFSSHIASLTASWSWRPALHDIHTNLISDAIKGRGLRWSWSPNSITALEAAHGCCYWQGAHAGLFIIFCVMAMY